MSHVEARERMAQAMRREPPPLAECLLDDPGEHAGPEVVGVEEGSRLAREGERVRAVQIRSGLGEAGPETRRKFYERSCPVLVRRVR